MKLLIMQFSPTSYHLIFFGPNILLSTLFSVYVLLLMPETKLVSHPYKTIQVISVDV
jgi:hypothetical protein